MCTQRRWTITEARHPSRHCIASLPAPLLCSLPCSRERWGFPGGSDGEESACKVGDLGSIPGSGGFPREGNWQPSPVFLPPPPGQRRLVGYSPWGHRVRHNWVTNTLENTDTVLFSCDLDNFISFFPNCINSLLNMNKKIIKETCGWSKYPVWKEDCLTME